MHQTRRLLSVLALALGLLALAGCGQHGATVKGTVVLPPQVKLEENDSLIVILVPEGENSVASPSPVKPDLSFVSMGPTGKGVPPGKYKITVSLTPYMGSPEAEKRKPSLDPINKQYDSAHTKLSYEVTSDPQQSITIDLAKGTVTK
jgi:hypothetical protein